MRKASGGLSKTVLFNLIYGLLALSVVLLDFVGYSQFTPDPEVVALVSSIIVPLVNLILRKFFTKEPVV